MNHTTRFILLTPLLGCFALIGCTQKDSATDAMALPPAAMTQSPATDDPCNLLTNAEVREVFGGDASGKRDHSADAYGILSCVWETPTDRFVAQRFTARSGTAEGELRSRVQGAIDPMMAGAVDRVRYEALNDVGDQAMMVIERADPEHGILADMALLVSRRGDRVVVLFTGTSLTSGDRSSALKSLETLGRSAVKRL